MTVAELESALAKVTCERDTFERQLMAALLDLNVLRQKYASLNKTLKNIRSKRHGTHCSATGSH